MPARRLWSFRGAPTADNIFYRLCPSMLLVPLVLLATVATVIASQSIITGAFSMTRQAIQLGWMPRLPITQTSAEGYGQIYVGPVNWLLMLVTIGIDRRIWQVRQPGCRVRDRGVTNNAADDGAIIHGDAGDLRLEHRGGRRGGWRARGGGRRLCWL